MNDVRCACPLDGARACFRFRYKLDLREMLGDELTDDEAEEVCECGCHDEEFEDFGEDYDVYG